MSLSDTHVPTPDTTAVAVTNKQTILQQTQQTLVLNTALQHLIQIKEEIRKYQPHTPSLSSL